MARTTIKRAIAEVLDDLKEEDYLKFCDLLRDRREEPRVSRRAVEGKRRWDIAEVLVSTFTEPKALQVALDLLRQINLNEEAEELDLKTKACADKGDPTLRKTFTGELVLKEEALKAAPFRYPLQDAQHGGPRVKRQKEVEAGAKSPNLSKGGDPCDDQFLLSRCIVLFGKYKGRTFKWLLENDVSYVAYVMAGHQKENKSTVKQDPLTANKDSLLKYAMANPEVREEVRLHHEKAKESSLQPGREGAALVGFGVHQLVTLKDLYESKDSEKIRYVNFLRTMKSTCTQGTRMETAVRYILQRDQEQATAATIRQTTTSVPQEAFNFQDSLLKSAMAYPEVREEVRLHHEKAKESSLQPGREGAALVGFGVHRLVTLKDLYESMDSEKIRYVNFLRTMKSTCTQGTRMETAVRYILQRDQEQATAATIRQTTTSVLQEAFNFQDSLLKSAMAYPEVREEVRLHHEKAKESSLQPSREGAALVGFGVHRLVTLKDLYQSMDSEKIGYVNFLRTMKSTCNQGTRMETAVRYILQRDQEQATAATIRQTTTSVPQEAFKRWTRNKRIRSASKSEGGHSEEDREYLYYRTRKCFV